MCVYMNRIYTYYNHNSIINNKGMYWKKHSTIKPNVSTNKHTNVYISHESSHKPYTGQSADVKEKHLLQRKYWQDLNCFTFNILGKFFLKNKCSCHVTIFLFV